MEKLTKTFDDFVKGIEQAGKYISDKAEEAMKMFKSNEAPKEPNMMFESAPEKPDVPGTEFDPDDWREVAYDIVRMLKECIGKIVADTPDQAEAIVDAFEHTYSLEAISLPNSPNFPSEYHYAMQGLRKDIAILCTGYSEKKRRKALENAFIELEHVTGNLLPNDHPREAHPDDLG